MLSQWAEWDWNLVSVLLCIKTFHVFYCFLKKALQALNEQRENWYYIKKSSGDEIDLRNTCNIYECLIKYFLVSGHKYILL